MRKLRNIILGLGIVFVTLLAVSCSSKDKELSSKTLVLDKDGAKIELTYYYDGDIVKKQEAISDISYKALGVSTKEEAEEKLKSDAEKYDNVRGIEHSIEYNDDGVVEKTKIDFTNLDYEKAKDLQGMFLTGDPSKNAVSLSKSEEMLKQAGFVEKK